MREIESRGDWDCYQKEKVEMVYNCIVKVQCGLCEGLCTVSEGGNSSHQQAMEDLAELCVYRLESDKYQPIDCTRPCQIEDDNWKISEPSRIWKHHL